MNDIRDRLLALVPNLGVLAVVLAIGVSMLGGLNTKPADKKGGDNKPEVKADGKSTTKTEDDDHSKDKGRVVHQPHLRFLQDHHLYPPVEELVRWRALRFLGLWLPDPFAEYCKQCECLIVTVPDPVETQFGFWFDQCVEAVQRAMSDGGGFTLECSWYPWSTGTPSKVHGQDEFGRGDHHKHPGVIVFQGRKPDSKRVVFLVGENPVNGVHSEVMTAALQAVAQLDSPYASDGRPLRLVGPIFTGSQQSLVQAVVGWSGTKTTPQVWAVSGSALGLKPVAALLREKEKPRSEVFTQQTAQVSLKAVEAAVMHYLANRGNTRPDDPLPFNDDLREYCQSGRPLPWERDTHDHTFCLPDVDPNGEKVKKHAVHAPMVVNPGRIAYLIEANSGYGEAATEKLTVDKPDKSNKPESTGSSGRQPQPPKPWVFRFPLHISRLAGIQSKERRERDERLGLEPLGGHKLTALDESRTGADGLPAADEHRTALLNQSVLTDMWAALRRERVRYVGMVATDPRDKVFLVEQLRAYCPNVQPFIVSHDLHYTHPEFAPIMRGTVVASTYPLYPPAQQWSRGNAADTRRAAFASSTAQGTYNATLAVLGHTDKMLDYAPPAWGGVSSGRPPIWVSVVGEDGGLVPLAYFTHYDDDLVYHRPTPLVAVIGPAAVAPVGHYVPPRPYALWVMAAALALAAGYALYLLLKHWRLRWSIYRNRGRVVAAGVWVAVGLLAAAVPLALYVYTVCTYADKEFWGETVVAWLFTVAALVFAAMIAIRFLWSASRYSLAVSCPRWLSHSKPALQFVSWWIRSLPSRFRIWAWEMRHRRELPHHLAELKRLFAERRPTPPHMPDNLWTALYVFVVAGGGGVLLLLLACHHLTAGGSQQILFVERAGWVARGSSVLVPAMLLAVGLFWYGVLRLAAAGERSKNGAACPYPDKEAGDESDTTFREQFTRIRDQAKQFDGMVFDLGYLVRRRWWLKLILGLIAATTIVFLRYRGRGTWEGAAWDHLLLAGLVALGVLTVRSLVRLWAGWRSLEKMLHTVARIPMVGAFDRLPEKVARMLSGYFTTDNRRAGDLALSNHLIRLLRQAENPPSYRPEGSPPPTPHDVITLLPEPLYVWTNPNPPPVGDAASTTDELTAEREGRMAELSQSLVKKLTPDWNSVGQLAAFGQGPPEKSGDTDLDHTRGWRPIAEQFVAVQVVTYLSRFLVRLRHLATAAVVASALLLVAVNEYPFQPEQPIMAVAVAVVLAVAAVLLWVLVGINRNEIISRVTRTSPDKFSLDGKFLVNVFQFVVPLVALVVVQLSGRMRSVFEPILEVFR